MRKTTILIASIIILFSCKKEQDIYLKDYLSDNGVNLSIKGQIGDHNVDSDFEVHLFEELYNQSSLFLWRDTINIIRFQRYTNDYQGMIEFRLDLNENFELIYSYCHYYFYIIVEQNKIVYLEDEQTSPDLDIVNLNYNEENGNLKFDFSAKIINDDSNYEISGAADVILYEREY